MNSVIVEHVRCFHERQHAVLRPVTVLVGENSSGKSTFLGLVRLAWSAARFPAGLGRDTDFNADPFAFGSYDQIATYRGGRGGLAKSFMIGSEFRDPVRHVDASVEATFVEDRGQPILAAWSLQDAGYRLLLGMRDKTAQIQTPTGTLALQASDDLPRLPDIRWVSLNELRRMGFVTEGRAPQAELNALSRLVSGMRAAFGTEPYAFAPIRTKPQRTYDPITDEARPEGSHVPVVLARMVGGDPEAWATLRKSLDDFGCESGLFDVVDVRRMGRKDSDPFQIRVKLTGPAFNLVDVGYGVSQVLPILVDCSRDKRPRTFLLQQPEVHLHPRAQAALGSWLAAMAKAQNKRFVIETHSDHLVDRLRMDVRDRKYLKPQDVAILYFERRRGATHIRHLELDERGNFKAVPEGYRSFFLEEERRMLAG